MSVNESNYIIGANSWHKLAGLTEAWKIAKIHIMGMHSKGRAYIVTRKLLHIRVVMSNGLYITISHWENKKAGTVLLWSV